MALSQGLERVCRVSPGLLQVPYCAADSNHWSYYAVNVDKRSMQIVQESRKTTSRDQSKRKSCGFLKGRYWDTQPHCNLFIIACIQRRCSSVNKGLNAYTLKKSKQQKEISPKVRIVFLCYVNLDVHTKPLSFSCQTLEPKATQQVTISRKTTAKRSTGHTFDVTSLALPNFSELSFSLFLTYWLDTRTSACYQYANMNCTFESHLAMEDCMYVCSSVWATIQHSERNSCQTT